MSEVLVVECQECGYKTLVRNDTIQFTCPKCGTVHKLVVEKKGLGGKHIKWKVNLENQRS